jgi:hypothetical protein
MVRDQCNKQEDAYVKVRELKIEKVAGGEEPDAPRHTLRQAVKAKKYGCQEDEIKRVAQGHCGEKEVGFSPGLLNGGAIQCKDICARRRKARPGAERASPDESRREPMLPGRMRFLDFVRCKIARSPLFQPKAVACYGLIIRATPLDGEATL